MPGLHSDAVDKDTVISVAETNESSQPRLGMANEDC